MKFHDKDHVILLEDFPEFDLRKGDVGMVVWVFDEPETYDVEFFDEENYERATFVSLRPEKIGPYRG